MRSSIILLIGMGILEIHFQAYYCGKRLAIVSWKNIVMMIFISYFITTEVNKFTFKKRYYY